MRHSLIGQTRDSSRRDSRAAAHASRLSLTKPPAAEPYTNLRRTHTHTLQFERRLFFQRLVDFKYDCVRDASIFIFFLDAHEAALVSFSSEHNTGTQKLERSERGVVSRQGVAACIGHKPKLPEDSLAMSTSNGEFTHDCLHCLSGKASPCKFHDSHRSPRMSSPRI